MKKMYVFRLVPLLLVAAITLFAVSPAFADPIDKAVVTVDETIIWPASENPCGFDIKIHDWGEYRVNTWLDENGEMTKQLSSYGQARMEYLANDKSLSAHVQGPIHITITDTKGTIRWLGAEVLVTIPGYGPVNGFAGQQMYVYTLDPETGEWNITFSKNVGTSNNTSESDIQAFCAYLSP